MNAPVSTPVASRRVDTDVLLVGLGPVGAALANLLGRYGVRVLAIDKATAIFDKPRAIALDNEALRILQLAGVRDGEFETVAIPEVQYRSPLFGRFARINSAGIIDGHPALVTFYQPELERLLRAKLAQYPGIEVRLGSDKVRLARTSDAPFTERLVRKFGLDTEGWRGANRASGD